MTAVKEFDGVVRHSTKPGLRGFRAYGCRCDQGCAQAGAAYRERARERDRARRAEAAKTKGTDDEPRPTPMNFRHGVAGYKTHGCRCDICELAYADRRDHERERLRSVTEPPDWSEVEHLKPGAGVRRRSA